MVVEEDGTARNTLCDASEKHSYYSCCSCCASLSASLSAFRISGTTRTVTRPSRRAWRDTRLDLFRFVSSSASS